MDIRTTFDGVRRFILQEVWGLELADLPRPRKLAYQWMRTISLAVHGFAADKCALRAAALTLVFIFSLGPALAVGFSVAKGFGAQQKIVSELYEQLGLVGQPGEQNPAAANIRQMLDSIIEYVDRTSVEALGVIGFAIMFYAAYHVLNSVERTMNEIWGVRRQRRLIRRLVDYVAVLFVFPIMLMLTALVMASLRSQAVRTFLGDLVPSFVASAVGAVAALAFAAAGFWFLYFFFPNTRVPIFSAAAGAIVAAVLWQILQFAYLRLQVGVSRYNAIYGTLAAVPIFVMWLHLSWLVVLFGAEISYAHANHRELEFGGLIFHPSAAYREHLALGAMLLAGRAFLEEKPPPTCEQMARLLAAPVRAVREVVHTLLAGRLLSEVQGDGPAFQPGVPLEQVTLGRVLQSVRNEGDHSAHTARMLERLGAHQALALREQAEQHLHRVTLLEILRPRRGDDAGEVQIAARDA